MKTALITGVTGQDGTYLARAGPDGPQPTQASAGMLRAVWLRCLGECLEAELLLSKDDTQATASSDGLRASV